ncbi:MAG: cob(I)yrinic acid a,c-diamide adenosyltransferase [Saprospiraceae bacterium]
MKIYTKTGDAGMTGLFGGTRLSKAHLRIESYGTVDELNSWLGLIRDTMEDAAQMELIKSLQDQLFALGAMLATDPAKPLPIAGIQVEDIHLLELQIDSMEADLPELKNFVLPGGAVIGSYCHLARCVCRRAERRIVALHEIDIVDEVVLKYLNRMSDFLFVLSRMLLLQAGGIEIAWKPRV